MAPESLADSARRRNDEAVRRLREESRLRVERGKATGPTRCMLGTMLALLVFVALESRRLHWRDVAPSVPQTRAEAASPAPAPPTARKRHCYRQCGISSRKSSSRIVCRFEDSK